MYSMYKKPGCRLWLFP